MVLEELKALLRYRKITYGELSNELLVTTGTFCNKINNKKGNGFTQNEIVEISKYLDLSPDELLACFFPDYLRHIGK
ncbi:helix-turn-helix domain-containing protein [Desulfitibacter alkalitolerans]|uniref:helix-turn-helix domain-containing protein n=1 Tax=Desulfitibacter alkalitolerans TaxID=264641 RepID=UPI000485A415|nr:helix-turn-helix domain-containing protein [Desulfitibacter alkalitolerans]